MKKKFFVSSLIYCLFSVASAQTDKIDNYANPEMSMGHILSLSIAAVKHGKMIKTKGYGLANIELNVAAEPKTLYPIASNTKPFTAAATMLNLLFEKNNKLLDTTNKYEIYALRFANGGFIRTSEIAIGGLVNDSVNDCSMIWLLKGNNGKNILVDAGFTKNVGFMKYTNKPHPTNYVSPLDVLRKINISADNITDVIITHPHADHIDGINLFPKAMVWMQNDDYDYFVGQAWQKNGNSKGFDKADVVKIVSINLEGRLTLIKGDSLEIIPGIIVFTGSKHTKESQYVLADSKTDKVLIASDNIWYYYNLEHLLSIPMTFDSNAYIAAMKRMKTLVSKMELIIPGHDSQVFKKFPIVTDGIVKIR